MRPTVMWEEGVCIYSTPEVFNNYSFFIIHTCQVANVNIIHGCRVKQESLSADSAPSNK